MTGYELELASIFLRGVAAFAAVGSLIAILLGLRQMRKATDERAHREDARHAESMEALRVQGEALRVQGEALRVQGEALQGLVKGMETMIEVQGQALQGVVKGMETMIERTAPKRDSQ